MTRRVRSAAFAARWLTSSGSATKSWIVCFGFSVSYGSWKMSWTRRRYVAQRLRRPTASLTSWPSNVIVPAGLLGELDDDPAGRRLAAARLADEAEHLAPRGCVRSMPSTARTTPRGLPPERSR